MGRSGGPPPRRGGIQCLTESTRSWARRRGPAMEYVGIDLHKQESQICLLTETGEVMERRIRTEPQRFAEVLGGRPRGRILVEASTESEWSPGASRPWVTRSWWPTRTRKVKTDRRNARALQEACLLGAYRPAHRLSDAHRHPGRPASWGRPRHCS